MRLPNLGMRALFDLSKIAFNPGQAHSLRVNAADAGSAEAAYDTGEAYLMGRGVKSSFSEAAKWWRRAANQNYVPAYVRLGNAYRHGSGVERDWEQARFWFAKAAENGDGKAKEIAADLAAVGPYLEDAKPEDPEGKYALALAYERGNVLKTNFPEAERLLRESVARPG
jgi:TPR repeat protein